MDSNQIDRENEGLRWSWDRYSHEHLNSYLVMALEDPRINSQSVLTRSLIMDSIFAGKYTALIDAELRFSAIMTYLYSQLENGAVKHELMDSIEAMDAQRCPEYVLETYKWLQSDDAGIVDYISMALDDINPHTSIGPFSQMALNTFSFLYNEMGVTGHEVQERLSILEPACGSANDYRFIDRYGLGQFISYTGFDISKKNIYNAKSAYPDIDFSVASMIDLQYEDDSFDYLYAHDLFEHLSLEAMEKSIREVIRIVKYQAWLHFFNVSDCEDHINHPVDRYHWNTLSLSKLVGLIEDCHGDVQVIKMDDFLGNKFSGYEHYNKGAYTLLVTKA